MAEMDRFLDQFAKTKNIKFSEKEDSEPIESNEIKKTTERIDFNVDSLLNESKTNRSILDDINPVITDKDYENFKALNEASSKAKTFDETQIRRLMQEELEKFFKDKYVLTESADKETIYFKVGDSLFKGELKLIK